MASLQAGSTSFIIFGHALGLPGMTTACIVAGSDGIMVKE